MRSPGDRTSRPEATRRLKPQLLVYSQTVMHLARIAPNCCGFSAYDINNPRRRVCCSARGGQPRSVPLYSERTKGVPNQASTHTVPPWRPPHRIPDQVTELPNEVAVLMSLRFSANYRCPHHQTRTRISRAPPERSS